MRSNWLLCGSYDLWRIKVYNVRHENPEDKQARDRCGRRLQRGRLDAKAFRRNSRAQGREGRNLRTASFARYAERIRHVLHNGRHDACFRSVCRTWAWRRVLAGGSDAPCGVGGVHAPRYDISAVPVPGGGGVAFLPRLAGSQGSRQVADIPQDSVAKHCAFSPGPFDRRDSTLLA